MWFFHCLLELLPPLFQDNFFNPLKKVKQTFLPNLSFSLPFFLPQLFFLLQISAGRSCRGCCLLHLLGSPAPPVSTIDSYVVRHVCCHCLASTASRLWRLPASPAATYRLSPSATAAPPIHPNWSQK